MLHVFQYTLYDKNTRTKEIPKVVAYLLAGTEEDAAATPS
jgi:hypothetical protein